MPPKRSRAASMDAAEPFTFSGARVAPDMAVAVFGRAVFLLHATVVRVHSPFFDASMSALWWDAANTHAGGDGIRFRYRVAADGWHSVAVPVPVPADGVKAEDDGAAREDDGARDERLETEIVKGYHTLFSIFYNKPTFTDHRHTFADIENLIVLADIYCALPVVAPPIEAYLRQGPMWASINTTSSKYLSRIIYIAIKIQSKALFNDAYVCTVGNWKTGNPRGTLGGATSGIDALVDAEVIRIQEMKLAVKHMLCLAIASKSLRRFQVDRILDILSNYDIDADEPRMYREIKALLQGQNSIPGIGDLLNALLCVTLECKEAKPRDRKWLACARRLKGSEYPWAHDRFN